MAIKQALAQYLPMALLGVPSTLLILFLMFIQTGTFNLNTLASGAVLIPLKGRCDFGPNRTCTSLNISNRLFACNGPLSCPSQIVNMFMMKGVSVVGVSPAGPTKNDTTVGDVVNMILGDTPHLTPFIILLSGQVLGWICLLTYQVNNAIVKGISGAIFVTTRISGFVAVYLNTRATLNDIRLNIDHPPSFLAAINEISPWLAFTIMLIEIILSSMLFCQPKDKQPRELASDLEARPIMLND
jgi:hypothetical protein